MYIMYTMKITDPEGSRPHHLPVTKAREELSDMINRVVYRGERVVLERRGKDVAAIVPMEDLKRLEELEDQADVEMIRRVKRQMKAKKERPIPWAVAKKRLGL